MTKLTHPGLQARDVCVPAYQSDAGFCLPDVAWPGLLGGTEPVTSHNTVTLNSEVRGYRSPGNA